MAEKRKVDLSEVVQCEETTSVKNKVSHADKGVIGVEGNNTMWQRQRKIAAKFINS